MPYDFKKEQRSLYHPGKRPALIDVPTMNYIAVRGQGDPNQPDSEYKRSIQDLYSVAYTINMSKKGSHHIPGYFDFVVPPLEGFWWQDGTRGSTSPVRTASTSSPVSACQILLTGLPLTGQSRRPAPRSSLTLPTLSFLPLMRAAAPRSCMSGRMMRNPRPSLS